MTITVLKETTMRLHVIPVLAGATLMSACATDSPQLRAERTAGTTLEAMMADADRAVAGGQHDKAYAILKNAGATWPAEKTPWVQMAQMKYERGSFGEAITYALEVLQRDQADRLGNSIVAVSGLRLSTKALADLSQQNNLAGVRGEAQELAKLLRTTLGDEVLVPQQGGSKASKRPFPQAPRSGAVAPNKPAPGSPSNSADPFGALK
jgi:Tfp pilus assembly protein PilF